TKSTIGVLPCTAVTGALAPRAVAKRDRACWIGTTKISSAAMVRTSTKDGSALECHEHFARRVVHGRTIGRSRSRAWEELHTLLKFHCAGAMRTAAVA